MKEQRQKDIDFITEYFRTMEHHEEYPFKDYTREQCLGIALRHGMVYIISDGVGNLSFLSQFDEEAERK